MKHLQLSWLLAVVALAALLAFGGTALAADKETQGKIKQLSPDQGRFVLTDQATNQDMTFEMAQDTKVRLDGRDGRLTDIKVGDKVTVKCVEEGGKHIAKVIEKK